MLLSGFMEAVTDRSGPVGGWLGSGSHGVMELRVRHDARQALTRVCQAMGVGLTGQGRYRAVVEFPDGSFSVPVLTAALDTPLVGAAIARELIEWDAAFSTGRDPQGLPAELVSPADWVNPDALTGRLLENLARALQQAAWEQLNSGEFGSDFLSASPREEVLATLLADGHPASVALHDASTDMLNVTRDALHRRNLIVTSALLARV